MVSLVWFSKISWLHPGPGLQAAAHACALKQAPRTIQESRFMAPYRQATREMRPFFALSQYVRPSSPTHSRNWLPSDCRIQLEQLGAASALEPRMDSTAAMMP